MSSFGRLALEGQVDAAEMFPHEQLAEQIHDTVHEIHIDGEDLIFHLKDKAAV